jgi:peptide/nickel transport system permease protein
MVRFLLRRLLFAALLVIAVSSGALLLTRLAPGDVTANLGALAPPDEVARTRARFDLDRSPVAQWGGWALRASRFDFGDSFLYNRPGRWANSSRCRPTPRSSR